MNLLSQINNLQKQTNKIDKANLRQRSWTGDELRTIIYHTQNNKPLPKELKEKYDDVQAGYNTKNFQEAFKNLTEAELRLATGQEVYNA